MPRLDPDATITTLRRQRDEAQRQAMQYHKQWLAELQQRTELQGRIGDVKWVLDGDHFPSETLDADQVRRVRKALAP